MSNVKLKITASPSVLRALKALKALESETREVNNTASSKIVGGILKKSSGKNPSGQGSGAMKTSSHSSGSEGNSPSGKNPSGQGSGAMETSSHSIGCEGNSSSGKNPSGQGSGAMETSSHSSGYEGNSSSSKNPSGQGSGAMETSSHSVGSEGNSYESTNTMGICIMNRSKDGRSIDLKLNPNIRVQRLRIRLRTSRHRVGFERNSYESPNKMNICIVNRLRDGKSFDLKVNPDNV